MNHGLKNMSDSEIFFYFKDKENESLKDKKFDRANHIIRGYYDEILEYILLKFPRKNIYIGISEEIRNNKFKYYNEIYEFLGATKLDEINNNHDKILMLNILKIYLKNWKNIYTIFTNLIMKSFTKY